MNRKQQQNRLRNITRRKAQLNISAPKAKLDYPAPPPPPRLASVIRAELRVRILTRRSADDAQAVIASEENRRAIEKLQASATRSPKGYDHQAHAEAAFETAIVKTLNAWTKADEKATP